jgi:glycosyltransferase involved in cell wall biosynthesis
MGDQLKVINFCYGGHAHLAEAFRPFIEKNGMVLITIHEWDSANIRWNLNTWREELKKADIIILPADYKSFPAKSNNKLTQAMSLGIPTICSPLPAYIEIENKYPGCCLIASNEDEWEEHLLRLRNSPDLRKEIGQKGLEASKEYHIDLIGGKWAKVFNSIKSISQKSSVDIVIPTYKNIRGIKLCIDSIRACTPEPYKIIVVNNGNDQALHDYLSGQPDINYIKKERLNFAQAINLGIKAGTGQFVMILNDDVIVSKGWLKELIGVCKEGIGAVGPLSNCDRNWLHEFPLNIAGVDLLPGLNTFEQIEPIIQDIYDFRSPYFNTPERDWVAFYCTLIPRPVLDKAGLLNESFTNSGEDVDLCRRIKKMGYKIVQNYQSFCFHFGAVSRKLLEIEDAGSYHEADRKTNNLLNEIWSKKSVMIYSGPSYEKWDFRTIDTTGIGGSETWQIWLSRELSKLGYRVISFADCSTTIKDGDITWIPYTEYPAWVEQNWVDYAILSRTTDPLRFPLRAGKVFVQIHDVWLLSEKTQLFLDRVDKFCALSQWHMDFASSYHGIPKEKMALTANGIDFKRFDDIKVDRHPYRFHWSSSLDRGLDNVLYLWPFIKKEIPEAELHIFYGILNWIESCKLRNDQEGLKKIAELEASMKQPGVFYHGRKSQKELAEEIKKASVMLAPNWFSETFGISFIECQYSGVPVITNKYAGVITTLGDSAIMLGNGEPYWPYSGEGRKQFLSETISLLKNTQKWQEWSDKGRENAKKYSWTNCALRWKELFEA